MEMQPLDRIDDHASGEVPEDVAILYSWANLEGAKYRDFSASRREYRAQMRHRAAEQLRLMELRAQSEAEAAAAEAEAEAAAAHAEADAATVKLAASRTTQNASRTTVAISADLEDEEQVEHMRRSSLREAAQQARRAAAERLEAARRAEAAALADSIARREEREIAESQASALRQAAHYAEAEVRSRQKKFTQPGNSVPGRISDPYGPQVVPESEYFERPGTSVAEPETSRFRQQREHLGQNTGVKLPQFRMREAVAETSPPEVRLLQSVPLPPRHLRGYRPDEPSGVRSVAGDESLIGETLQADSEGCANPRQHPKPLYEERHLSISRDTDRLDEAGALQPRREQKRSADAVIANPDPQGRVVVPSISYKDFLRVKGSNGAGGTQSPPEGVSRLPEPSLEESDWRAAESLIGSGYSKLRGGEPATCMANQESVRPAHDDSPELVSRSAAPTSEFHPRQSKNGRSSGNGTASPPISQPIGDSWGMVWEHADPRTPAMPPKVPVDASGPAWLYPQTAGPRFVDSLVDSGNRRRAELAAQSLKIGSGQTMSQPAREAAEQARGRAVENTLQHAREQVASRWFALKGIFANADRDRASEGQEAREKQRSTPFVVVCSMAGGVGKTSLVATLGRALSSLDEKVLLTDITSQGLLPFYFGASELHAGVVRTFSPPSGSSDAPIHLVSYDFAGREKNSAKDESEAHNEVFEDLVANSQRANRVLLDLNLNCGWMMTRMAWMKPTILVPLAADMNSVISLQAVERNFSRLQDADGKALQPMYLLNQFDASLPLHLDVREVLKQQLGDRLLPFVVRRASGVSEALAEGMTIVDYDPESEVAKDYMRVANWLRNSSAPATVGFRNLRWHER